jgi:phosphomannomutase
MDQSIFRAYDIRGVYGRDFNDEDFRKVGNAFSSYARHIMIVGRDCRVSSPNLKAAVIKGLASAGVDVADTGLTPRGAVMFWGWKTKLPSLYVTASHLTPEWNGVKFTYPEGLSLSDKDSEKIRQAVMSGKERKSNVPGMVEQTPIMNEYRKFLKQSIPVMQREMRVLLDCGNGTAGLSATDAFNDHSCTTSTLYAEPDGNFPNRKSEIKPDTLTEAMKRAKDFDMVVAFDGDADRVALVDSRGRYVNPDATAYVIMRELLKEQKGPVVANVESGRLIDSVAEKFGRKVIRTPVGYTYVMEGVNKSKASFGVERSMHFILPHVIPMDDGIVAGLYAAYAVSKSEQTLAEIMDEAPALTSAMKCMEFPTDADKEKAMAEIKKDFAKRSKKVNTLDGIRLEFDGGWLVARTSNTSPLIRLTVEAESKNEFNRLMDEHWNVIKDISAKFNGKPE